MVLVPVRESKGGMKYEKTFWLGPGVDMGGLFPRDQHVQVRIFVLQISIYNLYTASLKALFSY